MRGLMVYMALLMSLFTFEIEGRSSYTVVADSLSRLPLPSASVFDCKGNLIGICNARGRTPYLHTAAYPITVRYLGFREKTISEFAGDTIFLQDSPAELPEIVVETRMHKVLHILAYIREYSTLTSFTDTIFLFREKMVDYMLTPEKKNSFKGWSTPKIIKSASYYHFTNGNGLDSVSDESNYHFSWSDWVGIGLSTKIPTVLRSVENCSDTVHGKYSPAEVWIKNGDRVTVDVNVLADRGSRKWVPNFSGFFNQDFDFDDFKVRYNYDNVLADSISPLELTGYSFNIESRGRGHGMFKFNRPGEPFFVSTYAEVYILDKEYITVKEAKKWSRYNFDNTDVEIYKPMEAPELQPSIRALVARVSHLDKGEVRLGLAPDSKVGYFNENNTNFQLGNRLLFVLKDLTGIGRLISRRNLNKKWKKFRGSNQNEFRIEKIEDSDSIPPDLASEDKK